MELQQPRKVEAGIAGSHYYTLSGAEIRQNFPAHPGLLRPACHNNRAGWSAENWKLKAGGDTKGEMVFPGAALFHSSPTHQPKTLPSGFIFVSFIYSSLAAFHSFWTFDDLIRLSSCFSFFFVSVSLFSHSESGERLWPSDNKKLQKGKQYYITKRMQLGCTARNWS